MALIVETGNIVAGANSYITVEYADDFFAARFDPAFWSSLSTEQKEAALIMATASIDSEYKFYGQLLDTTQSLMWPRTQFFDTEGRLQGGLGVIPESLKQAVAALAYQFAKVNPLTDVPNESKTNIRREKVGPSEIEYFYGKQSTQFTSYINSYLIFLGTRRSSQRRIVRM